MEHLGEEVSSHLAPATVFSFQIGGYTVNITNSIVNTWILIVIVGVACFLLTRNLKVEKPKGPQIVLEAISCGAVFMGANTYIGNAPNFMVKSIAEENGIRMPSFFGYMFWSVRFLIPVFVSDMILFFL